MKIEKSIYGTLNGRDVAAYKLVNDNGMYATFLELGGTNTELVVKDKNGKFRDVVLQYEKLEDIERGNCFFGSIVGRNANRLANAKVKISGVEYKLADNDKGNNLHSGPEFFHKNFLDIKTYEEKDNVSLEFSYKFNDMEQGFPGNMDFKVIYTLTNDNELKIRYEAVSDKDSIFNPTCHSYFNLKGFDSGDIFSHKIKINADKFSYINNVLIPEKLESVKGTKLDFNTFRYMNDGIDDEYSQIKIAGGFDHNFVLNDYSNTIRKVAEVEEDESGIKMEVFTDLPGIQFYSGNMINAPYPGKKGIMFGKRSGFCLETQYYPNAINDGTDIIPLIEKGVKKVSNTIYKFS